jgi:hypothetical protein
MLMLLADDDGDDGLFGALFFWALAVWDKDVCGQLRMGIIVYRY